MEYVISIGLGLFGLFFGSFAGAQVWRLRAAQLKADKKAHDPYDKKEYTNLKGLVGRKGGWTKDYSRCLHCDERLRWYDLIPLLSWVSTSGKCRYCKQPIGRMEPLIELGTAALFVVSFLLWPLSLTSSLEIAQFILWLIVGVGLVILFVYDLKWFLLPDVIVLPLIGLSLISSVLAVIQAPDVWQAITDHVIAVGILSGLYYVLWLVSRGRLIGLGDIKLGIVLGLLLGQWQLAFLALFLANLIGCLIVLPGLMTKKLTRTTEVPFGPMLIAGFVIAGLVGPAIVQWYLQVSTTLML